MAFVCSSSGLGVLGLMSGLVCFHAGRVSQAKQPDRGKEKQHIPEAAGVQPDHPETNWRQIKASSARMATTSSQNLSRSSLLEALRCISPLMSTPCALSMHGPHSAYADLSCPFVILGGSSDLMIPCRTHRCGRSRRNNLRNFLISDCIAALKLNLKPPNGTFAKNLPKLLR